MEVIGAGSRKGVDMALGVGAAIPLNAVLSEVVDAVKATARIVAVVAEGCALWAAGG